MNNFTITAFADEISPKVSEQIRVLKDNQIQYIEVRGLDGKNVSELTLDEAKYYHQQFDEAGIKVSSIGSPIGKINIKDDFEEHLALFKHILDIAAIMESPYVRMFSFFIDEGENPDEYEREVIQRWQQFLAIVEAFPAITLLHENEKEIYGDTPERCLRLVRALNSPKVKLAFDPANFVQCDVEVYPYAFELLKEEIGYLHIKDALFSSHEVRPAGLGDGKVEEVLRGLVDCGYQSFASLEPHLAVFEGFAALEKEAAAKLSTESEAVKLFYVASEALRKILVEKMNQGWN